MPWLEPVEPQMERGGSVTMDKIAGRPRIARKMKENQVNAVMFS